MSTIRPFACTLLSASFFLGCGRDLPSAPTTGDANTPPPADARAILEGQSGITSLALDATTLYFTAGAMVGSVPRTGGPSTRLAESPQRTGFVTVTDASVYWLLLETTTPDRVLVMGKTSTAPPRTIVSNGNAKLFTSMVQRQSNFYALLRDSPGTNSPGDVLAFGPDGGSIPFARVAYDARAVAANDTHVYWTEPPNKGPYGEVRRASVPDGTVEVVANTTSDPSSIAVDDTWVFWVDGPGRILALRTTQRLERPELRVDGQQDIAQIVLVDDEVCWTDRAGGTVACSRKAGGPPRIVADRQRAPYALAADSTAIYWSAADGIWGKARN